MGRNRNRKPLLENIEIIKLAAEGKAIAKVDDKVVFVTNVIPGDVVDVQVTKKRKSYMEGHPVVFHKYSDLRVDAFCEHFGICGGCKWQNLPYLDQLNFKQQEVLDNLSRIGKIDLPEANPILPSAKTKFYRNKLEFTFSNKRYLTFDEINSDADIARTPAVGFHVPRLFDKVVDINKCHLQAEPSNAVRLAIKEYAFANDLSFFDIRAQVGFLRTLVIRTSTTGDVMVIVVFYHEDVEKREGLMAHLAEKFPEITSLMYIINEKANDSITDQEVILYKGVDHIFEQMEDLKFKIGPKSFYQTNSEQAYELYSKTREFANIQKDEVVYDLYTGTGTIANFVARQAKKVIGIEYVPEAIEDAKLNSEINGIDNTSFFAGDMKNVLNAEFIAEHGHPDMMIVDPPRAGMHADVVETILQAAPNRIVYVSCNSATQARDLEMMDNAYKVTKIQAVDMFPHTHHVENIVLMEKR
ncbi:23S rRNA (uracil(1939)-C(5))-methyltransferase RlmD [Ancylomarina euxinus]|uniref:23S rRNA (Uracil(1939)-C(5))-methyltransferase RlmD n=1 Tax=Ancylomarina euxinus TaxID=2283627 RepID=A0A425Y6B7_9BACT|nr:23S rRNA (uracil(1939)-C(5))-methyltransferase RlmD [Ancylomarina euxinus]MCZ4694159.1 23S rRNA (uracil(1939)-C(5))-methyltransferase RlmD [Ancylomarina euxinus]MUP15825.1 23S rRNA (uracil(1939)-C(5))-methyltransferase RlmD [Ancylomarina euxinus]RRG23971.1 23S rRNA (uracil(1939)-C(5))-methyltransferase RlmD [Ancylomarina euxinus]